MDALLRRIWNLSEEYIVHLVAHTVNIIATLLVIRILIYTVNMLFTNKLEIIDYIEGTSQLVIFFIFIFYILNDIYDIARGNKIRQIDPRGP